MNELIPKPVLFSNH